MALDGLRNTFAGNPLDRAAFRRLEPDWLAARLADGETRVAVLWNGTVLATDDGATLAWLAGGLAGELGAGGERLLFLGVEQDGGGADARAVFALDLEGPADPTAGPLAGHGHFVDLRQLAARVSADEAAMAATARAMFEWRRRTRFCPACGSALHAADGGWRRACAACGVEHFPRTDPVVIMLPVNGERCLLGRQASWAAGRYSALAGFMEPGESIEEACAREIAEEAGLVVRRVAYHSSQPWPFPANLMIGLLAEVEDGEASPHDGELEAVRWVTRDELRAVLADHNDDWTGAPSEPAPLDASGRAPSIGLPPPLAIARRLIESWANGDCASGPGG